MHPRPIDPDRDLPAVANLLGRTRANGGLTHPGGTQWWLRELVDDGRDDFEAFVWGGGGLAGFALVDGTFVITETIDDGPTRLEQLEFLEGHQRGSGRGELHTHVVEGDPIRTTLKENGYQEVGSELELLADTHDEPPTAPLPDGFRFGTLDDVTDETYIDGHRAAWSDRVPSPYRRELHEAVKRMPQFRPDLVTIVLAPNGTMASYCIGWIDDQSKTLEIEPLGTHRDYRRLGLARAVVREVQHRAWANGAEHVLVWNNPATNPDANALYTRNGMPVNRRLIELKKTL